MSERGAAMADGGAGGVADEGGGGGTGGPGGAAGGEWWRVDRPWSALGPPRSPADDAPGGEPGVYVPEPPEDPPAPRTPPSRRTLSDLSQGPGHVGGDRPVQGAPGWEVRFDPFGPFGPGGEPDDAGVPAPRAEPEPEAEPGPAVPAKGAAAKGAPAEEVPGGRRRRRSGRAAGAPAAKGGGGAAADRARPPRRPSPLLLFAAVALLAGAVTGELLVMLLGWGAAYLTRRLSDFTRKFVVLGIPLVTMSASALWYWGRMRGRWGEPLPEGAPVNHALWVSAPGVLRVAAVLTAVAVLVLTLRRRRAAE